MPPCEHSYLKKEEKEIHDVGWKFASGICTIVLLSPSHSLSLSFFHFLLLANVEVVERGADELQGLVEGVRVQATGVQNVHSEAYVPARENIIERGHGMARARAPLFVTFGLKSRKLMFSQNVHTHMNDVHLILR